MKQTTETAKETEPFVRYVIQGESIELMTGYGFQKLEGKRRLP
jgi:hypothetical protein